MQTMIRRLDKETIRMEALVYAIGEGEAKKVFARAMNHEGKKGYTAVRRKLNKQTSIKVKDIRRAVGWHPASYKTLKAAIRATGRPFSLRYFGARQFRYGVRARVWGKSQRFEGAFMVASLGNTVFKNTGGFNKKSRRNNAIEKLWGPSLPKELLTDEVVDVFRGKTDDISDRAAHELQRILDRG